jgi:hypothetical protein
MILHFAHHKLTTSHYSMFRDFVVPIDFWLHAKTLDKKLEIK